MTRVIPPHILAAAVEALSGNVPGRIAAEEKRRGNIVIRPGDAVWLPLREWHEDSVCAIHVLEVRLILLRARAPGRGSLIKTIAGIRALGMKPSIIEPTERLSAALERRGWKMTIHGSTFEDREEVWRP